MELRVRCSKKEPYYIVIMIRNKNSRNLNRELQGFDIRMDNPNNYGDLISEWITQTTTGI